MNNLLVNYKYIHVRKIQALLTERIKGRKS